MLRSLPRWKKHELMLLWCRTPIDVALAKKVGSRACTKLSGVGERLGRVLGLSRPTTGGTSLETWASSFVGQLIDENVRSVLIVGAIRNDAAIRTVVERLRSGDPSIEAVCHDGPTAGFREFTDFDCVIIRNSAVVTTVGIDTVSSARVLVVCETESFQGHEIVSRVLSLPDWEPIGSHEDLWDGCLVFRRMDASRTTGSWEILDLLHRS